MSEKVIYKSFYLKWTKSTVYMYDNLIKILRIKNYDAWLFLTFNFKNSDHILDLIHSDAKKRVFAYVF